MIAIALAATIVSCDIAVPPMVKTEAVDVIEINHTYSEFGEPRLHQIIYWRWRRGELVVASWRMISEDHIIRKRGDVYVDMLWKNGVPMEVTGSQRRETWTQYDPEIKNREKLPEERREWKLW